ncbi:hypothetical protein [Mucilaginibacter flavidus]|uniref:hypothetical protein n=1 Tax=Mucilaginibacter flavidus TaxID=2949309 RepID=UPI0020924F0F|nr:hypothetical protein [Mucilaginibacter flavidus]MCO5949807.1 hypothetical protein [Mucilaginibacter flavidus]
MATKIRENPKSITWEKLTGNNTYATLGTTTVSSALAYQFIDANPKKGIQYYRAKLITDDGRIIYSDLAAKSITTSLSFMMPAEG